MTKFLCLSLAVGLAIAAAAPASAASRDSDGDVTSVIAPTWQGDPKIIYRFDAIGSPIELTTAEIDAVTDAGGGTLRAGGEVFAVETEKGAVILRHVATGERHPGVPIRVSSGGKALRVNPTSYGLD
ncbi:hypothetical protein [Tropicimonas sediminicola]|uniref:Uncharacterized protein n=1 Tax=Tropicimonas sediminicola TaxID=1031541 RepID=A0A239JR22_9RHOB|nr:hypothetical protein [Tropicimonas sediminicola]SNT08496.1 hypothetical protein SAMN05421757_10633 [Tropicimonas sediminicola]